jgi:hypothetical protein
MVSSRQLIMRAWRFGFNGILVVIHQQGHFLSDNIENSQLYRAVYGLEAGQKPPGLGVVGVDL